MQGPGERIYLRNRSNFAEDSNASIGGGQERFKRICNLHWKRDSKGKPVKRLNLSRRWVRRVEPVAQAGPNFLPTALHSYQITLPNYFIFDDDDDTLFFLKVFLLLP